MNVINTFIAFLTFSHYSYQILDKKQLKGFGSRFEGNRSIILGKAWYVGTLVSLYRYVSLLPQILVQHKGEREKGVREKGRA